MHLHFLGICGTFMGSLALLAREFGHTVTGCDANVYPPMSTQLAEQGITLVEGYDPAQLTPRPDAVIVGNALSRGNPVVEAVLEQGLPYTSGPQWLCDHVLVDRWVLAVAGTHGKTTTTALLAWMLEQAGLAPGFLIGGVPTDFPTSARLGAGRFFVIEADEYDTAFFDKRSKFVHYRPRTLILNNLEYDHADIFEDLAAIQRQFHHVVRTVPGGGRIIRPADSSALDAVLAQGCWSPVQTVSLDGTADWRAELTAPDGSAFTVFRAGAPVGEVRWSLLGRHNVHNALAAIAAAEHAGVAPEAAVNALSCFGGIKRRLEKIGEVNGVTLYDDFAHHPTAIATTLEGLRTRQTEGRILAVIEPRSNTMQQGVHRETLRTATAAADRVIWYGPPTLDWDLAAAVADGDRVTVMSDTGAIVEQVRDEVCAGDSVVIMSNGGFEGIHDRLCKRLDGADDNE